MAVGFLFAMTLPGVVVILTVLAVIEQVLSRRGRRSIISKSNRTALSASGMDVFSSALMPGKAIELEQRRVEAFLRDDDGDAAPPQPRLGAAALPWYLPATAPSSIPGLQRSRLVCRRLPQAAPELRHRADT
jgi:Family of unknown function (DUF6191)